jgi:hypothetical protein
MSKGRKALNGEPNPDYFQFLDVGGGVGAGWPRLRSIEYITEHLQMHR